MRWGMGTDLFPASVVPRDRANGGPLLEGSSKAPMFQEGAAADAGMALPRELKMGSLALLDEVEEMDRRANVRLGVMDEEDLVARLLRQEVQTKDLKAFMMCGWPARGVRCEV